MVRVALAPLPARPWAPAAVAAAGAQLVEDPADADVLIFLAPDDTEGLARALKESPQASWVQLPWAGIEAFVAAGVLDPARTWTCGKGVYAEPVAEHALALALAGLRELPRRIRATTWEAQGGVSLYDGKATILGGGGITECLVDLLTPMRTEITVVRRDTRAVMPGVAHVVAPDALHEALRAADAVFLALALTPETRGVIDAAALRAMQPHAWLVNVARGAHVVTDDLVLALRDGWIGGAGLDVTDPEPLPDGHPLWDLPNCIITPHTANSLAMGLPLLARRVTENLRRFAAGEPLVGLVDLDAGY
ncbi:MAG TPA: NAD(P)-dependent oxidoreductase [Acidimicrobiales bacterium]|nr:NAD(P)-dependent oxidoreductase [Acidimicrobiales bacterium]